MEETARKIKENASCWYAVYTASRAEKKVKEQLDKIGIDNYLPLQPVIRMWNNRKKKIFIPVVPGCLFVYISSEEIAQVTSIHGVTFAEGKGQYVSIPEVQMETFRAMIERSHELVEFAPTDFVPGATVQVIRGQLQGLVAELVECQGNNKLLLRIEGLGCALATVSVDCVVSKGKTMKLITEELLDRVTDQAKENSRLRMNYNFHESMEAAIHRMLNALEPGTYLPPHRHKNPDKEEVYLVLRGSLLAILFDDEGNVMEKVNLNPTQGRYGIEIPPCVWHTIIVLESGTVIYEIKQGPFAPLTQENLASWAPPVADKEAARLFMERMLEF